MKFIVSASSMVVGGCALPTPPDGGPRDTSGPVVVKSNVAMGGTQSNPTELAWTFNEFIVLNNPATNVRISPPLPGTPTFTLQGKTLKLGWVGTLDTGKTYLVQFGNGVRDLHEGNVMAEPYWVFATGASIDSGRISGSLVNPWSGTPWDNKAVVLHAENAQDSAMFAPPIYGTRSGKDGRFVLPYLAQGRYQIFAFDDSDGNLALGTGEMSPIAWYSEPVTPGDSLVLWLADPVKTADSLVPFRPLPADSSGVLKLTVAPETNDAPWVHELRRDGVVVWQGTGAASWTLEGLKSGKYLLQSFVDLNENGRYDAPNWWTRTEAEMPIIDPETIEVTVGWTVERLWRPGASPSAETDPDPQGTGSAFAPPQGGSGPIQP